MVSTLIDCIHSASHEVDLLIEGTSASGDTAEISYKLLKFRLGNLKMVLLCAKMLGIDLSPSSLVKTEGYVRKIAEFIPTFDPKSVRDYSSAPSWVLEYCRSLLTLAKRLHTPLLDVPRQSISFPVNQILEFISFSLENLENYQDLRRGLPCELRDAIKALQQQLTFLQSLIQFVIQINVEDQEDLLAHARAVTIDAAFLLFDDGVSKRNLSRLVLRESFAENKVLEFSRLMQKIKPIHPQVYKTYTEALISSKFGEKLLVPPDQGKEDDESLTATSNLLSSLVSVFYEELAQSSSVMFPIKDQLQKLYEGLRSLRKVILKHPEKLDSKMRGDIVNVICDAGVFICSFQMKHVDTDLSLVKELSEAIKMIVLASLGKNDAQVAMFFNSRSTTQLAFVDFLIEKLMELTRNNDEPTAKNFAQTIQEELVFFRSFLEETVELPNDHQEELQALRGSILEVANRIEDLIEYLLLGNLPGSDSESIVSIMKTISNIKSEIEVLKRPEIELKKVTAIHSNVQSTTPLMTKEIVGFHDRANSLISRLKRGSRQLRIVAIVGMPGLGKTTIAEKVYNDPSVSYHFSVRAFTTVSQSFDKKGVLLHLLKQVDLEKYSQIVSDANAEDVAEQLWRSLKGKPYLIVLDDIWDIKAWQELQRSFPDDSKGSRIMVTSRRHDIVPPDMLDEKVFELRLLNEEESLDLLQRQLFGKDGWPPELGELGKEIVEICNGLPLTILIVAGVLKSSKPEDWKKITDGLSSGDISDRCRDTLELSYKHLPEHLKPCLLYFATFQEDQQLSVRRLLSLWMAEGFVRKAEMKRLSDVAQEYLYDLIGRSLLMVSKKTSMGQVKRCRIHDLLHEFCLQKSKEEQFFHFLEGDCEELSGFNEPGYLQRLCIHSVAEDFIQSEVFCPRVRSLRFRYSEDRVSQSFTLMMHICKRLRVLDLEQVYLDGWIPSEIGQLVRLAYLAIGGFMWEIPSWIGNLLNLETLIIKVDGVDRTPPPESFWNLRKLKHFSLSSHDKTSSRNMDVWWPLANIDNSPDLCELESMAGVAIPCDGVERVLKKFPNLRKLGLNLCGFPDDSSTLARVVVPEALNQLESLDVYHEKSYELKVEFSFPTNLKRLSLRQFKFSGSMLSSIGKLPNLEYLKLDSVQFEGNTWIMEDEQFSKLRILKLFWCELHQWSGSDDQLGCLEKLELHRCYNLKEMPSCLETIPMLQTIKATSCSRTMAWLLKKIGEQQVDYGNSDMKITISDISCFSEIFFSIMKDITNIKSEIKVMKKPKIKIKKVMPAQSHVQSAIPSVTNEVVGFQDLTNSIVDRLKRKSKSLRIVAIVGMPGISKTTLAVKVYNDPSVSYHFCVRAFTTVAQGKRVLIVLDDIWEAKAWQKLQASFPDDSKGSRIIFTSRRHDVAPPTGILRSTELKDWKTIIESSRFGNLSERWRDTLELSYRHLSQHLKPCLLYFATFQEDQKVPVKRLLSLWMAEGFVRKVDMKRLSDVAGDYLTDLIRRSLLMVAKQTSMGRVKRCRIHDLLYEFCSQKAKEEHFFHFLGGGGYNELSAFNEPWYLRRLCIHSGAKDFVESKLFCPHVGSLRFKYSEYRVTQNFSPMMQLCKLLKSAGFGTDSFR
ncbi:OLC1v1013480C1 [Oldenlandia corymbosa var. corymbosa]|uniref:OLC1v1013480C1 n=1 Tax=Oldenlandia corymbosa var. corymbosa TaxID=529605 RepID=A0AAV1DYJ7_OLDCO|nr:OLC1v1013480C1 [Oldenlandia corymbosa var. corymbosa]